MRREVIILRIMFQETKEDFIMAICPNCGAQVPDGVQFCGECGAPLAAQQPVQQQYQQPYQQQPTYGYRQAAQQAYGAQMQQKAPGAFGAKMKGFFNQLTSQPNGQVDFNLLRILSLVFAIGFILFSLGLGSRIYYNRNIGEVTEDMSTKETRLYRDLIYATFRMDPKGVAKAMGVSNSDIKAMSKDDIQTAKDSIKDTLDKEYEEYGFRMTMFKFGTVWGSLFLWVGLIIALCAAGFWWLKGGRPYNIQQSVILPAVIAACAIFVILFIVNLAVATCNE